MLNGWGEYVAAFGFFFLSHSIPVCPPVKSRLSALLSPRGFTIAYSALSLFALGWLIVAAGRAPAVPLWDWAPWQNLVTFAGMALACAIAALAIARPNPLSFGGARNESFDPAEPGIVGWTRHPLLLALLIWALVHLPPNGDLAHVVLFGLFAGFSLLGMRLVDRRKQRQMGMARWRQLAAAPARLSPSRNGLLRMGLAILAYAVLLAAHGPVIGVTPVL